MALNVYSDIKSESKDFKIIDVIYLFDFYMNEWEVGKLQEMVQMAFLQKPTSF